MRAWRTGWLALAMLALAALSDAKAEPDTSGVPILLYHRFHPTEPGSTTVTDPSFDAQLEWLEQHGYRIVTLGSVVADLLAGRNPEAKRVVITVDDGRRSQFTDMFPILLRHHAPATLFVYTRAISYEPDALTWEQIREMEASGLVDVQSHTCTHPNFDTERARRHAADYEAFVMSELEGSKATLEKALGHRVEYLAWPYGVVDQALSRAAARAGYFAAFAVEDRLAGVGADSFAIPRVTVHDDDRDARFERLLKGGRRPVAEGEDIAAGSCDTDSGGH